MLHWGQKGGGGMSFSRWMEWVRQHYTLTLFSCLGLLAGLALLFDPVGIPFWAVELLAAPLNLVTWPLLVIHLRDLVACYKAKRPFPGSTRLQLIYWIPAATTTGLTLHLLASF